MKTLQILPSLDVGGVERGVIDLARAAHRRGEGTVVISKGGALVKELQKLGVPHYTLPVHKKSLLSLRLIPKIARIIRQERIDIVHARSRVPGWLAWFAARMTGVPFVTTCHGYYSNHLLSRIMGWGKRVIVISRIIGRHMIDDFGVSPERIRLVHRGVDLSQFERKKPKKPNKIRPFRIINVGRFSPIKGQVEFLKAIHELRREHPHIEVWLVGSEGKKKRKYTKLIEETIWQLGLKSCVKLLGTRRDVPDLIAQADLLVLSTLVPEAFGRVIIEAGAVGTPVVSTRVGGVLDIIDHRVHGLMVPPGDLPAMSQAMAEMIKNPEAAKSYADALYEKVHTRFGLEQMMEKTFEVYEEVRKEKKILVVKLGAMGDVILVVPSLRMLRNRFPDAHITLLVDKKLAPLVSECPYLDEIIPVDRKKISKVGFCLKLAKQLRQEGYDLSVDFQNSKWTHLVTFLAGIRERAGFQRGFFGFLLNRPNPIASRPEAPIKNQFRILSKLGVRRLDQALELWSDQTSQEQVATWLPQGNQKVVGFVLGASPLWPTKRWPLSYFEDLARRLLAEGHKVVLIGLGADQTLAQPLMRLGGHMVNLVGKTDIREMIALIDRLDLLVTGDSAPLHVASAVETKTIALFGPTDARRHRPPGNHIHTLSRALACQPCYKRKCFHSEELACLKHISVNEVFELCKKQLKGEALPATLTSTS